MSCKKNVFEGQRMYIDKVRQLAASVYGYPKACINTFGCQQNVSDSEHIKGMLVSMGYGMTEDINEADFILFNTCAVREHAEDRVYGNIGITKHIKENRRNVVVAVCGCMAQQPAVVERIKKSYPYVDLVFGTHVLHRLPEFLYRRLSGSPRVFDISTEQQEIVEGIPVDRDRSFKGWLPIMYGCNNFCTYCIVPYVRGRERSRSSAAIIAEAEDMIKSGIRDITLLGQNVNSYGKGLSEDINFAKLLRKINDIPGDFRIRFMTSHPKDCTEELLDAMRDCKKVCRHLHLPFQSGNDRVLRAMNRHYDRQTYLSLVRAARQRMPDIQLTSDVIVGFPGESYDEFLDTVSLVKEVEFDSLFTFIFSPRRGTPAYDMPDDVTRAEKGRWFNELLAAQSEVEERKKLNIKGKTYRILCEERSSAPGRLIGRTEGMLQIEIEADDSNIGNFLNVMVTDVKNVPLGTVINE